MESAVYDLVVLGGGPGGYVSAIRASQLGLSVALVEARDVGGTCLNRGCIPTKALANSVSILATMRRSAEYGISAGETIAADFDAIMKRKSQVVARLRAGVEFLLKKHRVTILRGRGRLQDDGVLVEGVGHIQAKRIIVATGSKPQMLPGFCYDGRAVMTSDEILECNSLPADLLIVGGGIIGCELACIFSELGVRVILVELLPHILPSEDREISSHLQSFLKKRGIVIRTGERILNLEESGGKVIAALESGEEITAERAIISVGRVPATDDIGLEDAHVDMGRRSEILVDDGMRTSNSMVYAIGDATAKVMLAHVASKQGIVAAHNIAADFGIGERMSMDYSAIPSAIFTMPEIGTVGVTEDAAREAGIPVIVGKFPFVANGKAIVMGQPDGMVKLVAREDDKRLIGVHIIGPGATELVSEASLAIKHGLSLNEFEDAIRAHPTLSEALGEAAAAAEGMAIHYI